MKAAVFFFAVVAFLLSSYVTEPTVNKVSNTQSYSCVIYAKTSSGSPASYVKVTGYYSSSNWSSGTNTVRTDGDGKAVLEWSSNKPLHYISFWDGNHNYDFEGTFEDGETYTFTLDKSHIK